MDTAIDFSLINFCRVFSLQTTLMIVYSFAKKFFPYIQRTYFDVFFTAESIGTISFAIRARFLGVKWNFSVLIGKKLKKFSSFKPIEVAIKKILFKKFVGTLFFFLTLKNIRFRKKWALHVCP